jgi:hypothetical protein
MGVVTFSPQTFLLQYPEFSTIDQAAVVNASVPINSNVMTINSVVSGAVAVGEAVCGSAIYVPNSLPLGITIQSIGTFNGTSGTVILSAPVTNAIINASLTLYAWNILNANFNAATYYCNNDGSGIVQDVPTLTLFLTLITAHLTALNNGVNGQTPTQMVGRISSVGEGSVHVSLDMKLPDDGDFWAQTKYGLQFYQMSTNYRFGGHYAAPQFDIFGDVGF